MKFINYLLMEGHGQIVDVCIDTIGIALGICAMMVFYKIMLKILRKDGVFNKQE